MEDRPETAAGSRPGVEGGNGYPLREEATEPFPPPPPPVTPARTAEPLDEEIYAAPVEPGAPIGRRRFLPGASPWPVVLAVLLLLTGLGVAYAVTRPGHRAPSPPPAAAAPSPPPAPAPPAPAPSSTTTKPPPARPAQPSSVAVPSVVGSSLPRAVAALEQAKLTAIVSHVPANAPVGQVVAQSPAAGTKVTEGGRVRVNVAIAQLVSVPNVTEMQGLAAAHTLQGDHLVPSLVYVPSTEPARRVVSQWPPAGNRVKRGTSVRLNLSQGLRPTATVPNVVGEDESTARSDLVDAGFGVRSVDTSTSDPSQDGLVVDESPGGGTSARHGSTVTITIGRYSSG